MQKIAIMGAGSLGTILGAYLNKSRPVDLIDVNKEHVDAINKNGAKVIEAWVSFHWFRLRARTF